MTRAADRMGHPGLRRSTWRLLQHGADRGAMNMAIDEAIAEAAAAGRSLPTLRFYDWAPPCLSLGRNQPWADVDQARRMEHGFDLVRRPTGGRAILHVDELTYSVSGPAGEPRLHGGVLEVYHRLCAGLLWGLGLLGASAEEAPIEPGSTGDPSAACFDIPSAHEITASGRKLVGSAQCRKGGWILQHGSLPLRGDVTRIVDVLAFEEEEARSRLRATLAGRATTLEEVMGRQVNPGEVARALGEGFAQALNLELLQGTLSDWEMERAAELRETKYSTPEWTRHR